MNVERALTRAILANPSDPGPRLVYADWLEECGDPTAVCRAEYLRLECSLDVLPSGDGKRRRLQARLLQLRGSVGDEWWCQLDWAKVEYCVEFEYRCPQRWDTLQPTDNAAVRHCQVCQQNVYYCQSAVEAENRAAVGQCVAIDSRRPRLPLGLVMRRQAPGRLLGTVAPRIPSRLPLNKRGAKPEDR